MVDLLRDFDLAVDEGVPQELLKGRSLERVLDQDDLDEVSGIIGYLLICWELVVALTNLAVRHLNIFVLKWRFTVEENEYNDAKGPDIHFEGVAIVHLAVDHLGSEVVRSSAHRVPALSVVR